MSHKQKGDQLGPCEDLVRTPVRTAAGGRPTWLSRSDPPMAAFRIGADGSHMDPLEFMVSPSGHRLALIEGYIF